jgi:stage III sporulation protein AC
VEDENLDVTLLFKIAGVGFLIAVAHQILQKSGRDEMALLLSLSGIVAVLFLLVGKIGELFGEIRSVFGL